ncbi:hypothetical protein AL522_22975 [Pantoea vagans]|nr:hypothetical protein AL522_22975 [Pantoea vagans]
MRREHGQKRKASRAMDKNAGSVFEQRNALARLRAHLMDEVRNRAGRACQGCFATRVCSYRFNFCVVCKDNIGPSAFNGL